MRTIIEMYDSSDPIYNVLIPSVMQPDQIVFFSQHDVIDQIQSFDRYFGHVLKEPTLIRQIVCDIRDVSTCVQLMNELIDEQESPDECVIDVTGGNEALLMAVGMVCASRTVDVVLYQHITRQILHLWGKNGIHSEPITYCADVVSRILLSGGDYIRNIHVNAELLSDISLQSIPQIFRVNLTHRTEWHHFSIVLQHMHRNSCSAGLFLQGNLSYTTPNGLRHMIPVNVLRELEQQNIIGSLCVRGAECSFTIQSEQLLQCLCDSGSWLQLFVWHTLHGMQEFDDVRINMTLSWRKDVDTLQNTVNEVDVLATCGPTMFLISCKTGKPQMSALNEIATLTRKFGGVFAVPILATTCDLTAEAPAIIRRAFDMDIQIIDASDLENEDTLRKRLLQIAMEWNKYQEQLQW